MRLALLPVFALLVLAPAAQADRPETRSPAEIAAYWTKDRMEKAIPRYPARAGEPRPSAGKPRGGASAWTRLAVPLPYSGDDLANGKVFMTIDGANYVCSGTSVAASESVNLVWTAGHCVNEGPGDDATSFMFAPGYVDGTTPYGKWVSMGTHDATSEWSQSRNFDYDVGAARVVRGEGAYPTLAAIATPREMAFDYPVTVGSTRFDAYGYPAAGKFNGRRMYVCQSTVSRRDGSGSTDPMGIGCDMTGGSSGGGWIDANGDVASVNSYGYSGIKNTMFGPYQGSVAEALYTSMR